MVQGRDLHRLVLKGQTWTFASGQSAAPSDGWQSLKSPPDYAGMSGIITSHHPPNPLNGLHNFLNLDYRNYGSRILKKAEKEISRVSSKSFFERQPPRRDLNPSQCLLVLEEI
ncbi:hypothetical protein CEXT_497851 [Caerostris extrusa]|uniref:Uncharacterized protein n=1 Tax=Caerostris extrusa TaxID=172846 RepID=A0AAV4PGI2_CAEEX|nr:hypothetical protein CEXT_497851 [Caerostris extrusa]